MRCTARASRRTRPGLTDRTTQHLGFVLDIVRLREDVRGFLRHYPSRTRRPSWRRTSSDRDFVAPSPNPCWLGTVRVAIVVDTFSRLIVGWSAATS